MKKVLIIGILLIVNQAIAQTPGTVKWIFDTKGLYSTDPAIGIDGTIYVSAGLTLYAINPDDGTEKWRSVIAYNLGSPVIDRNETIYVLGNSLGPQKLIAINSSGIIKWELNIGFNFMYMPVIGVDRTIYLAADNNKLYAINPDGSLKWETWLIDKIKIPPVIGLDGSIYIAIQDYLCAYSSDGSLKWNFKTNFSEYSPIAIGSDGIIYLGGDNGLYAISPDGTEKWSNGFAMGYNYSVLVGADDTIYGTTFFLGSIFAIDIGGMTKWTYATGNNHYFTEVIGKNGNIYFGSRGYFSAINPDGVLDWEVLIDTHIATAPVIGDDGTIIFYANDGRIWALYSDSGGIAERPWPMFQHDIRHTGRAGAGSVKNIPTSSFLIILTLLSLSSLFLCRSVIQKESSKVL